MKRHIFQLLRRRRAAPPDGLRVCLVCGNDDCGTSSHCPECAALTSPANAGESNGGSATPPANNSSRGQGEKVVSALRGFGSVHLT